MSCLRILDRDIAGKACRYYAVIIGIAASLLLLENIPRVVRAAARLARPMGASLRVIMGLVPEYLAMAGIFGIYVTAAMLAYRLVRRNELAGWWANGISTPRITAGLVGLAAVNAVFVFVLLGWLQPLGEASIVTIDRDIASGRYGVALEAGVATRLGSDATILFDHVDAASGKLIGVFVTDPVRTISAHEASLSYAQRNSLRIDFRDGVAIDEAKTGETKAVHFRQMHLVIKASRTAFDPEPEEPFQKLLDLPGLLRLAGDKATPPAMQVIARGEALYRVTMPFTCLLLAWLGFVLGLPDRTESSAAAVALGVGAIVVILRITSLIRFQYADHALAGYLTILGVLALVCLTIPRLNQRFGQGFIDHVLARMLRRIGSSARSLLGLPATPPDGFTS